jgi:hypothetical protein
MDSLNCSLFPASSPDTFSITSGNYMMKKMIINQEDRLKNRIKN